MRFRRLSCLVAAVVLTVTFVVPNGTSSALECEPMYVELDVVNGQLSDACASSIQEAITEYFSFRQESFCDSGYRVMEMNENAENEAIRDESINRNDSLREFWEQEDVYITRIESEAIILLLHQACISKCYLNVRCAC